MSDDNFNFDGEEFIQPLFKNKKAFALVNVFLYISVVSVLMYEDIKGKNKKLTSTDEYIKNAASLVLFTQIMMVSVIMIKYYQHGGSFVTWILLPLFIFSGLFWFVYFIYFETTNKKVPKELWYAKISSVSYVSLIVLLSLLYIYKLE